MPDTDGVSLLKEWATAGVLTMPVIMMSGHATIDTAVEATRIGAFSFLEKPITLQKLLKAVEQGLARNAAHQSATVAAAPGACRPCSGRPHVFATACCCRPSWLVSRLARTRTRALTWTAPCAKRAMVLKKPISNSTWPAKAVP